MIDNKYLIISALSKVSVISTTNLKWNLLYIIPTEITSDITPIGSRLIEKSRSPIDVIFLGRLVKMFELCLSCKPLETGSEYLSR